MTAYLTRLYGPLTQLSNVNVDVMTALVSLRAALRGARPRADDRRADGRRDPAARPSARSSSTHVDFTLPDRRGGLPGLARGGGRPGETGAPPVLHDITFRVEPGRWSPWSVRAGPARRPSPRSSRGSTTSPAGRPHQRTRRARRDPATRRHRVGVVTQDAHLFHDTMRANLLYARPDATEAELKRGARRGPGRSTSSRACPTGSTRSSASAATGSRGARSSAWRSPGYCSRRRRSSSSTRRRRTSTRSPRRRSSRPSGRARRPDLAGHRPPTLDGPRCRPVLVIDEGRIVERGTHDDLILPGRPLRRALPDPVPPAKFPAGRAPRRRRRALVGWRIRYGPGPAVEQLATSERPAHSVCGPADTSGQLT